MSIKLNYGNELCYSLDDALILPVPIFIKTEGNQLAMSHLNEINKHY